MYSRSKKYKNKGLSNFRLVSLHGSLKKLLPADYLAEGRQTEDVQVEPMFNKKKRSVFKRTMEFNGVQVSLPQYLRLMELQEKVLKLDLVMRKFSDGVDPDKLAASSKWGQLVSMRQSLQKLLPEDHPNFNKRAATMDFNGVQVRFQFADVTYFATEVPTKLGASAFHRSRSKQTESSGSRLKNSSTFLRRFSSYILHSPENLLHIL